MENDKCISYLKPECTSLLDSNPYVWEQETLQGPVPFKIITFKLSNFFALADRPVTIVNVLKTSGFSHIKAYYYYLVLS